MPTNTHFSEKDKALYLASTEWIDWQTPSVTEKANELCAKLTSERDKITACFEFVRDHIQHTGDAQLSPLTFKASDVLETGSGYCFAKSHLLAALLRANQVPTALCYQRLSLEDFPETLPPRAYTLHGLNAVYLNDLGWIRLDARGNKANVNAQFNPPKEQLAFNIRFAGEQHFNGLYPTPEATVLQLYEGKHVASDLADEFARFAPHQLSPAPYDIGDDAMIVTPQQILDFWFSKDMEAHWFNATPEIDAQIKQQFEETWQAAKAGKLQGWAETREGMLALIIVLDQLPLNMFRGQPESFSTEGMAITLVKELISDATDNQTALGGSSLTEAQWLFMLLPLMHSEDLATQDLSVQMFTAANIPQQSIEFAKHHRGIVQRFGRFPHRNTILGRVSTPDEIAYLASDDAFTG